MLKAILGAAAFVAPTFIVLLIGLVFEAGACLKR